MIRDINGQDGFAAGQSTDERRSTVGIQPVKRVKISEQVFEQIKQMLIEGEWTQGQKIPSENELAQGFGVSRVTVRQALQKLTVLGLIETRLGEGSFVCELRPGVQVNGMIPTAYLGENSLSQVLEFRQVMDVKTAELAAQRADEQDVAELGRIYQEMVDSKEDIRRFAQADLDFHLYLARATHNPLILEANSIVRDVLGATMDHIVTKAGNRAGLYYHRKLLDAVSRHDVKECGRVMQEHVDHNYELLSPQTRWKGEEE